jgi:hypothetical protein
MHLLKVVQASVLALLFLLPLAEAAAAPQLLGVVAGAEARPLTCRDGTCSLYLSSFCILKERAPPVPGTVYSPARGGGAMTLVVTAADGGTLRVPAARHVRFESYAGYTAVRASLSRAALGRLGGVALALEIGPKITLIPAPTPGDPDPLGDEEIALATGPWRVAAERFFERGEETTRVEAARLANVLINALPETGRASAEARDGLWARVAGGAALHGMSAAAIEKTRVATGVCRGFTRGVSQMPLRRCLERTHDAWMMDLNEAYWDALVGW